MSGNSSNWNPSGGTLGQLGNGFQTGDFSNFGNQVQGGSAPIFNNAFNKYQNSVKGTLTDEGVADVLGVPAGLGTLYSNYQQGKADYNSLPSDVTNAVNQQPAYQQGGAAAQTQAQAAANTPDATQQSAKNAYQQNQQQAVQTNKNQFQQENSLEDALRAAQLKQSGQNANANFY